MTLRLHNTLDRKKAEFAPLDPANVRMYVCGPTVYDVAHIGNARPVIVFDVLYRLLRHVYGAGNVTYVRNITDVDDKIIAASETTGEAIGAITARTTDQFHADMAALGALAVVRKWVGNVVYFIISREPPYRDILQQYLKLLSSTK